MCVVLFFFISPSQLVLRIPLYGVRRAIRLATLTPGVFLNFLIGFFGFFLGGFFGFVRAVFVVFYDFPRLVLLDIIIFFFFLFWSLRYHFHPSLCHA